MFIPSFLQPQNNSVVETLIQNIESQLNNPSVRFIVDEKLAEKAREVFRDNLNKNQLVSKISCTVGVIGAIGLWGSLGTILYQLMSGATIGSAIETFQARGFEVITSSIANISPYLLVAAAVGFVFLRIFHMTRNREGYQLQKALDATTSADRIRQLSLGANIYQKVAPNYQNVAAADHLFYSNETQDTFVNCKLESLISYLSSKNEVKALVYFLMIVNDRKRFATNCLLESKPDTAQFFIDLGADMSMPLYFFCNRHQLDLLKILVRNGAKLDEPFFTYTPLEALIPVDLKKSDGKEITKADVINIFEALSIAPDVYNQKSAAELFTALNFAGVAVRLKNAEVIHQCLQRTN